MPNASLPASRLAARRQAVARAWALGRGTIVVASGLPVPIAGTDQAHGFHAHPEYRYLAGDFQPGAVLTFDPGEGWTLFAPLASEEERIWVGDREPLESVAARTGVERVLSTAQLADWLERRRGEPAAFLGNRDILDNPAGYGIGQWAALELTPNDSLAGRLSTLVSESRRAKDEDEIESMRAAAAASHAGHLAGLRFARPGITERQLQVEIEAGFFRAGSLRTAYGSIVGAGANGAVLHFAPTSRVLRPGELVLVDAGAEADGYASDVTRTYPAGASFTGIQRDLYQLVLDVQEAAIRGVRPGAEYRDLHMAACEQLADGLVQLGILRGTAGDLVDRDAHALFFPHGLGHMLGLSTHDAGGCLAGRTPSDRFGLRHLRADLPLQEGYVVTIEPGIYFIRPLLTSPERRLAYASDVNWELVDELLDFGGIRIEDDVLVTATGAEVLTAAIPKSVAEIESLRAGGLSR